jgi:hypothetical protein
LPSLPHVNISLSKSAPPLLFEVAFEVVAEVVAVVNVLEVEVVGISSAGT